MDSSEISAWLARLAENIRERSFRQKRMAAARLPLHSVDIAHRRLSELMKLADAAEPFYRWVEKVFRHELKNGLPLSENMMNANSEDLTRAITKCYHPDPSLEPIPSLFDGGGKAYPHRKGFFYFFSWLLRDAPQQRLSPLIGRATASAKARTQAEKAQVEIQALVTLLVAYRETLKTFEWPSVREVVYDRLEGSRRSIKGHEKEIVVRTALATAVQRYFKTRGNYGTYRSVSVADKQIKLGNETFDVSAELRSAGGETKLILLPVKTRETEGGGHSHIFTRDINSAILAAKEGGNNFVVALIIAQNWSEREQRHVLSISDLAIIVNSDPNDFSTVPEEEQARLDEFIQDVLDGRINPKTREQIREAAEAVE